MPPSSDPEHQITDFQERENCFVDACNKGTTPVGTNIDDSNHNQPPRPNPGTRTGRPPREGPWFSAAHHAFHYSSPRPTTIPSCLHKRPCLPATHPHHGYQQPARATSIYHRVIPRMCWRLEVAITATRSSRSDLIQMKLGSETWMIKYLNKGVLHISWN
jgi:hypothetical protein